MKYFIDGNLSPYLARAIAALCEPFDVDVIHKYDRFARDTDDVDWINALATEGKWVVISGDRFLKNPLERETLRKHGFTVFILKRSWSSQKNWEKAAQLVRWWPRIMDQAELVTGGAAFGVPYKISGKGKFESLKL